MTLTHGRISTYKTGCRCEPCRAAKAERTAKRVRPKPPPAPTDCRWCGIEFDDANKRGLHMYHHHRRDPLAFHLPERPPFDLSEAACVGLHNIMDADAAGPGVPPAADLLADAKAVCIGCPLIDPCRDWAVANGEVQGVWGGVWFGSAKERAAARRAAS